MDTITNFFILMDYLIIIKFILKNYEKLIFVDPIVGLLFILYNFTFNLKKIILKIFFLKRQSYIVYFNLFGFVLKYQKDVKKNQN